jgi:predicted PurR-regulated permease PerM
LTSLSNLIATTSELEGAPRVPAFQLSMQTLGTGIASALGLLVNLLGPVVTAILTLIFTLLISLQISLAKDDFVNWYPTIAPVPYRKEFMHLVSETNKIWNRFLRGQLTLMVVIGGLTWIGNLVLGTPQPLFLAIIAGLLEIIPNIGPFLATIPAVILALMFGSSYLPVSHLTFALIVVGLYVLIQALENNLIVPHVMGDAMDLSPVIVLIACLAGGSSFGLIGVFLATPVVATGRLLFNYLYGKMLESGPPPATEPEKPSFLEKLATFFQKLGRPLGDQPIDPSPPTPKAKIKSPPADKKNNSELSSDL